jgi:uncharacterized membrane protein
VTPGWLRPVLVAAGILAYTLLQHYANVTPHMAALGAPLAVAPLVLAWLLMAQRSKHPVVHLTLAALLAALVLWRFWPEICHSYSLMFMLQEAGVNLTLAVAFGRSLAAGRTPLCTQWARMLHGPLNEAVQRYTRHVTLAWTVFFLIIELISATLYTLGPLKAWSFFSNFLTMPLAAVMFAVEYEVRRHRLPWMQRARFADMARAYAETMRRGAERS